MDPIYPPWLTKQMVSGIRGFNMCAYLLALEGWRRGLNLRWYYNPDGHTDLKGIGFNTTGKFFSLSDGTHTHYFFRSRGDLVSTEALDIASDKNLTKQYLSAAGVPISEGTTFSIAEEERSIIEKASKISYPLVIKPALGSLGKGVVTNISTEQELKESLQYVKEEFSYESYIMEKHVEGDDYRIYVIGDKVLGAIKRVPANVVGDGIHSIKDLITFKNEQRRENPHLATRQIKVTSDLITFLKKQDKTVDDIANKDELIFLRGLNNISSGGDSIDVTDELPSYFKQVAVNTVKAVPGLIHAGIDVIIKDKNITVIEINATAGITLHSFPMYGRPRNVPAGIVDYYFPATKKREKADDNLYYDHKTVLELMNGNAIQSIEISHALLGPLYAKRYVVSGKVQGVNYRRWIRKRALENGLCGYTRNLSNGKVVVVVGGIDEKIVNDFYHTCVEGPERAEVQQVKAFVWDKQIKVGFEIRKDK
ncbi:acylphosphatase [Bacillus sp. A301a_S52]|jgi:D-alanine-D-alanine ligase-like ATP-grasp enzyme/acylphosphatase|nr:acylphosphatase [Bacillus sp. A301a_S52]